MTQTTLGGWIGPTGPVLALLALLAALGGCGGPNGRQTPSERSLSITEAGQLSVTTCWDAPPRRFAADTRAGAELLGAAWRVRGGLKTPLKITKGGVTLDGAAPGDCVRVDYPDLRALALASDGPGVQAALSPALSLRPDLFIWPDPNATTQSVRVDVPEGWTFESPWQGTGPVLKPAEGLHTLFGRVVVGPKIRQRHWTVADTTVRRVQGGGRLLASHEAAWINSAVTAAATIFDGRFPVPIVSLVVVVTPGDKVGFGEARRGGGGAVMVIVGDQTPAKALRNDWTLIHELLHLGLPATERRDAWFSEGLATYLQNIAMARSGLLTPAAAWQKLRDGFRRGERQISGRTLREDSEAMGATGRYWRVYWAGAAFALELDLLLRARGQSLDTLVQHWLAVAPPDRARSALAFGAMADAWLKEPLVVPLMEATLARREAPDWRSLFEVLGIEGVRQLRFRPNALRDAIMLRE